MKSTRTHRSVRGFQIAFACLSCLFAGNARAQAPVSEPAKPADTSQPSPITGAVIRTESRLVLVDAIVTDKKGNYLRDLTQQDFKVFEDNKEQQISSFSFGSDPGSQSAGQKRYMILFFDNSSMEKPDQIQARAAAAKFIDNNAGPDRLMAVVDFGGSLVIRQNFTARAELLKAAISGVQSPNIETNGQSAPIVVATAGLSSITSAEADFGVRTMLLAIRSLAKNLRAVPGRKMLILFSAGFPLDAERTSELTATINDCNKANVAVYTLDARGLMTGSPGVGSAGLVPGTIRESAQNLPAPNHAQASRPRLISASYRASADPDPQKPGGGGGTGGGGGGGHGGGGTGGTGGTPGGGSGGGKGGTGGTGGGTGGKGGGTPGGGVGSPVRSPATNYFGNNPLNQPNVLLPKIPTSVTTNQQILQMLADGTGGFAIYNTNDLLGGLGRIAHEQNEFYVLGYVPQETAEGSCHTIKVKMNRGGTEVRARSFYCNTRPVNALEGKPLEKQMEIQAAGSQQGSIHGAMQVPYFYTAPNVARVNLTMEIPGDALLFNKDKGKYHANVNVLGIAYKPDGSVGARFSDTLKLDLEKDDWKEVTKQPYHYENQFDAAPGSYKLAVVLSSGGDSFGKFESPLVIDSYDGNKFTLGGVVLSTNIQRVDQIPADVDATMLEDRTPLLLKGMQITPAGSYQFKKTDSLILYSEVYEPLLKSETPPKVAAGYHIFDKATNKDLFFSQAIPLDDFIQKGNAVVPFGLKVQLKDLAAGNYRLVLLAVDGAKNQAPPREVEFTITN